MTDKTARMVERLRTVLASGLSVQDCQLVPELAYGRHWGPPPPTARRSAVMILLYRKQDTWHTVLTVRPEHLASHGGQVCFPGGRLEPGESPEEAALREWQEELGAGLGTPQYVGMLPELYVFNSDYRIMPCIYLADVVPRCLPNPAEVSQILEVPVAALADPARRGRHWVQRGRLGFQAPHIHWQGYYIWGVTAILCELLADRVQRALGDDAG
ncbi:MAG: hypothetical protein KatS3mg109_0732 [Pirellulaceae bacterium]|nr:MAG: hypothetical protein KatS3mg109_0732 [Pirellulaceae bacterium]